MVDAVKPSIQKSAKDVDWDKMISKGEMIEPSRHIIDINSTLNSMFKVLRQNLSMPQNQIENEIMFQAILQIIQLMENLYVEQIALK